MNGAIEDWAILELQGSLETKEQCKLNNLYIGTLLFDLKGTPYMVVGYHLLKGVVSNLDNPVAVMSKSNSDKNTTILSEDSFDNRDQERFYEISAIIRKKISFHLRPKPILIKK